MNLQAERQKIEGANDGLRQPLCVAEKARAHHRIAGTGVVGEQDTALPAGSPGGSAE